MDKQDWHIVVMEDEYDSLRMVSKILSFHGIHFSVANNGRQGLQLMAQSEPTCVITDLAMPEMDGWSVLEHIRANPDTRHIPVVAVTAYHSSDVERDAEQAGFDAYFAKPVNAKTFVNSLEQLLSTRSA
jgi:CheY-like chemotaxis protein